MTTSSTTEQLAARLGLKGLSQLPANDQDAIVATLGNLFRRLPRAKRSRPITAVNSRAVQVPAVESMRRLPPRRVCLGRLAGT